MSHINVVHIKLVYIENYNDNSILNYINNQKSLVHPASGLFYEVQEVLHLHANVLLFFSHLLHLHLFLPLIFLNVSFLGFPLHFYVLSGRVHDGSVCEPPLNVRAVAPDDCYGQSAVLRNAGRLEPCKHGFVLLRYQIAAAQ